MPIDKDMLSQLRQQLKKFEQQQQIVVTRQTMNSCVTCYSAGGCYGTCKGTCGGGCSAY